MNYPFAALCNAGTHPWECLDVTLFTEHVMSFCMPVLAVTHRANLIIRAPARVKQTPRIYFGDSI